MEPPQTQVKRPSAWSVAIGLLLLASTAVAEPRVIIISIDGCRPDVALRADMPTLRGMMARGAFTFWATTTPAAITLPSHTSMLTGVTIERHGVSGNDDDAAAVEGIRVPTLFDLAKAAGLSTAMASGKSKFLMYAKPIDFAWQPAPTPATTRDSKGELKQVLKAAAADDDVTTDHAIELLQKHRPRVMLVHFGRNDVIGHSRGWGSKEQLAGLASTDRQLGRLFTTLRELGLEQETTVILSADHGGVGRVHGKDSAPSRFIPWVIVGPGVRANLDLSQYKDRPIRTYDTFATACRVLGLSPAADIDGAPVLEAFEGGELLKSTPTTDPVKVPATLPKEKF